ASAQQRTTSNQSLFLLIRKTSLRFPIRRTMRREAEPVGSPAAALSHSGRSLRIPAKNQRPPAAPAATLAPRDGWLGWRATAAGCRLPPLPEERLQMWSRKAVVTLSTSERNALSSASEEKCCIIFCFWAAYVG